MEMLKKQFFALLSALVALTLLLTACGPKQEAAPEPSSTPTITVTADPSREVVVDVAKQATAQQGFDPDALAADEAVDQKRAKAVDAGHGVFSNTKLTTPAVTAAFMASGSPAAKKAVAEAIKQTGATPAQLADPANWVAITTGEKVSWQGNTYYMGGAMLGTNSAKVDPAGSVIMVFVPPAQVAAGKVTSVFFIRGACGNPQTKPPKPHNPPKPSPECIRKDVPKPAGYGAGWEFNWYFCKYLCLKKNQKNPGDSTWTFNWYFCKWLPPKPKPPSECVRTPEPTAPPAGKQPNEGYWWERLSDCSWHWVPRDNPPCVKPAPPGPEQFYNYDSTTCTWHKKPVTWECQQNGGASCPPNQAVQPPQDNPRGVNTGTTPGAPPQPSTPAPGPSPSANSPAPSPTPGGYNSGSSNGSGTPGGSLTDQNGTSGGGAVVPSTPPANTGQGGTNNNTDPGGF